MQKTKEGKEMNSKIETNCFHCQVPKCREACPIHNRIPEFLQPLEEGNWEESYRIIRSVNPLGAICGRVCPHEKQCQGSCIRGKKGSPVAIGRLEAMVCDWAREHHVKIEDTIRENGKKVALIGGGPASIATAVDLRKLGYAVTILEREDFLGGILMYGIPEYRLSKTLVQDVIQDLLEMGIHVRYHTELQREEAIRLQKTQQVEEKTTPYHKVSIASLWQEGYQAIFLGMGAECSNSLPIEGMQKQGVWGANEFLRNPACCQGKKIAVIGGGNVAMDAARVARHEGAEVLIIYRRREEDMPANREEVEAGKEEGISFLFQTNVIRVDGDTKVETLLCDTGKQIEVDGLIVAVGSTPNATCLEKEFALTENGLLQVDEHYETTVQNVFAGGDMIQKKATVCMAIQNGKQAAIEIDKKLSQKRT